MCVCVEDLQFDAWESLPIVSSWSDTFILRVAPTDGLPPVDYAAAVHAAAAPLRKLRPEASVWVQVGSDRPLQGEGNGAPALPAWESARWYVDALRYALRRLPVPVAVSAADSRPGLLDFSFLPYVEKWPCPPPASADPFIKPGEFLPSSLACLRVLARSDCAYTAEVAALAGLSRSGALAALRRLEERRLVGLVDGTKYPLWQLRRPGVTVALRSWGVPPGRRFWRRKERGRDVCRERRPDETDRKDKSERKRQVFSRGGEQVSFMARVGATRDRRHRRAARMWPAWLRRAWPRAEIWAGWTEVTCGNARPDALAWGLLDGHETLFWLEVESGHDSRRAVRAKVARRASRAWLYARRSPVRLVFALLAPFWVCREAYRTMLAYETLPVELAAVVADWRRFGVLPEPGWGEVRWG